MFRSFRHSKTRVFTAAGWRAQAKQVLNIVGVEGEEWDSGCNIGAE